jgi:hypothetical protein
MKAYDRRKEPKSRAQLFGGRRIRNATGSTLAEGALVYVSGWSETYKRFLVTLADADVSGRTNALFIVRNPILNGQNGVGWKTYRLQSLNTSAGSVSDPVYLSATAGGWTLTAPYAAGGVNQIVGRIAVDDATVGEVEFDLQLVVGSPSAVQLEGLQISGLSGETEGAALRIGTAATPLSQDSANTAFISGNFVNDATTGTTRGLQITLDVGGNLLTFAECIKAQLNVTAQSRNPVALQGDMTFSTGAWVQGAGYGVGTYVTFPGSSETTGEFAAFLGEFNLPASCNLANTVETSVLRFKLGGDGTAVGILEDHMFALYFDGLSEGTGNMFSAGGDVAAAATLRIRINTTDYFILLGAAESN